MNMIHGFPIEFVRIALEQTLQKLHNDNPNLVGGKNQIEIHSFYEQLKTQDEVNRFVETFRDLTEQQNRSGLIANGILMSPENPTITNLYTSTIIPMSWACSLRVKLSDRDVMLETINALIDELKGSKVDIAELKCRDEQGRAIYVPFAVGTIGHNLGVPSIKTGDYIGEFNTETPTNQQFLSKINDIKNKGVVDTLDEPDYIYFTGVNKLLVAEYGYNLVVECDEYEITDINYDQVDNKRNINGTITFKSFDNNFSGNLPSFINPILELTVTDGQRTKEYKVECVIDRSQSNIDASGYINFVTDFSFLVNENAFDWANIDVSISGAVNEPITIGFKAISSSDNDIIFPPEHESFEKYKLSLSFEGLRCDTPRTLNGDEYCEISFGGSATLVNESVKLGNDLIKISMKKNKILAQTPITFSNDTVHYLEPLELPSGNGANTIPNQLTSNVFKVNTHTDSLTATLQYTFILDEQQALLKQLFKYGRYGTAIPNTSGISPNMIFNVDEWWSAWGVIDKETYLGKLIESIDIENTESDTLTLSITMQVQGANN